MKLISLFFILFLLLGCSSKEVLKSGSYTILFKTDSFKFYDSGFINQNRKSISARISELRKLGYQIDFKRKPQPHYKLQKQDTTEVKILKMLEERKLWNKKINIDNIAKLLKVSRESIIDDLVKIRKKYPLIQINNNEVIILQKLVKNQNYLNA